MKKLLEVILLILTLAVSGFFLYSNIPHEPVPLGVFQNETYDAPAPQIEYGNTPVFMENLRFNHKNISYFIEPTCEPSRRERMRQAVSIFEEEMKIIEFREVISRDADIQIGCSDDYIEVGDSHFAAGEGGPSLIINTSKFKIIEKGKISLYKESECEYPVVELHELSHVFGFNHIANPLGIMNNVTNCEQRITPDMTITIQQLYSIRELPDAEIKELSGVKKGKYLDFNITIGNEGLVTMPSFNLTIISKDKEIAEFLIEEIEIGHSRILQVSNVKLNTLSNTPIDFYLDEPNNIEELGKENNFARVNILE